MTKRTYKFSNASTDFYLANGISHLKKITDIKATVLITDEHVYKAMQNGSKVGIQSY